MAPSADAQLAATILGYAATGISAITQLPHVTKTLRTRNWTEPNVKTYMMYSVVCTLWIIHGILIESLLLIVSAIPGLTYSIVVLGAYCLGDRPPRRLVAKRHAATRIDLHHYTPDARSSVSTLESKIVLGCKREPPSTPQMMGLAGDSPASVLHLPPPAHAAHAAQDPLWEVPDLATAAMTVHQPDAGNSFGLVPQTQTQSQSHSQLLPHKPSRHSAQPHQRIHPTQQLASLQAQQQQHWSPPPPEATIPMVGTLHMSRHARHNTAPSALTRPRAHWDHVRTTLRSWRSKQYSVDATTRNI